MRRIYVASSWRNVHQPLVVELLRDCGHEVYDFRNPREGEHGFHWSAIDPNWEQWQPEAYKQALQHPVARSGFQSDWDAMQWADTGVLVLPCGRSAHLEAGYFSGAGKELFILLMEPQEPELMYRMATEICLGFGALAARLDKASVLPVTSLVVKLDPTLDRARVAGLLHNIKGLPGVDRVCDMQHITQETLSAILLSEPDPPRVVPVVAQRGLL